MPLGVNLSIRYIEDAKRFPRIMAISLGLSPLCGTEQKLACRITCYRRVRRGNGQARPTYTMRLVDEAYNCTTQESTCNELTTIIASARGIIGSSGRA